MAITKRGLFYTRGRWIVSRNQSACWSEFFFLASRGGYAGKASVENMSICEKINPRGLSACGIFSLDRDSGDLAGIFPRVLAAAF